MYLILSPRVPVLFMKSLILTAVHRITALMGICSRLSKSIFQKRDEKSNEKLKLKKKKKKEREREKKKKKKKNGMEFLFITEDCSFC